MRALAKATAAWEAKTHPTFSERCVNASGFEEDRLSMPKFSRVVNSRDPVMLPMPRARACGT
ncbi:hypothetical protein FHX42_004847 [Saccharopolyspora lacisalsi]|uniref:Uncharacterized protein n=1 Tax=Halosaccharopolyspora lacisalsi TaxID=1000566 RepID=A0A839E851_9PSEU|nr:hypothetical protein [Halosaccharopolyspora lacisalsi]